MILVILLTLTFPTLLSGSQSYFNEKMFTFDMFENFEVTKLVFQKESQVLLKLKLLKKKFEQNVNCLKVRDLNQCQLQKSLQSEILNLTSDFPNELDFEGAKKGMVFLHDTYNFDIKALVNPGN